MSVRTDVVNLIVNVNGDKSQAALNNLRKRAADLSLELKNMKKGTEEYIKTSNDLKAVNAQMDALKKQIGITALTQKELIAELNKLRALKGSVAPFSAEFKELDAQIKKVEGRLYDVRNGVQGFSSFFSKIKDEVKQFGVLAAGYLGFQFITTQFTNIIRGAGKLSDQLADLQRVAGLTADEADALNDRFKKLDTRTSTEGLREIAIIAGKLGVAKDDIYSFTKAVDQLVVSLGDELGDADQITTQLGKILNVFDGKITGDNITRLGNAFVELANTGSATGGFIADFDQRLSGIAKSANIGLGALSGLGAGLEEMGGRVESSSTAIQKLIIHIAEDIPGAAKVAGLSVDEFSKLFAKDGTEALLRYSEGLVKNKESFEAVTASLKENGEEGARTIETISKLGSSADILRKRIELGKKAIEESTAITGAFELKNETFGATLDKLGKEFNKLVTSPAINNFLKSAIENTLSFLKAIQKLPQFLSDNKTGFILLAVGIATYNAAMIKSALVTIRDTAAKTANVIVTRLSAIATTLAETATAAYIIVTNLLAGRITIATAAQRLWNTVLSLGLGPIGLIITAIGALVIAFGNLGKSMSKTALEQRAAAELAERAADIYGDQVNKLEQLKRVLTSTTSSLQEKKKAYEELIAINPDFQKTLTLDTQGHLQGASAIDVYIAALKRKGEAEAAQQLSNEVQKEILKKQRIRDAIAEEDGNTKQSFFGGTYSKKNLLKLALKQADDELEALKTSKAYYDKKVDTEFKKSAESAPAAGGANNLNAVASITLGSLKAKLKELEDAYEKIDITNKKGLADNLKSRQEIQKQIDTLEGKKTPSEKKGESEFARLKKEAQQYLKEVEQLKKRAQIKGEEPEQAEIDAVKNKYEELLLKAKEFYLKKALDKKQFNTAEKTLEEAQLQELQNIFEKYQKKRFDAASEKEYDDSLLARKEFADQLKKQVAQEYADDKISKQQYEDEIKKIDLDEAADRIIIAQDYSKTVKKAAADVTTFKKEQEKSQTQDALEESEKRKKTAIEEALAKAQRNVLNTRPGTDARLKAQKDLLQLQFEQETKFMDKKSEMYKLKEKQLHEDTKELDKQFILSRIEQVQNYVAYFQDALNSFNQFINNRENRILQKEKSSNDAKRKSYKDQLDSKLISQQVYDKKIAQLAEQEDKHNAEIKRRQAKREKALNLFNAIVNTAAAVIKMLADPGGFAGLALSIAAGVTGALQVAAIANTPLPEAAKGNWFKDGKKHKDGGMDINIEQGEAVVSAAAMDSNKKYTVSGTTSQITSALNKAAGGVNWAGGAIIKDMKHLTNRPARVSSSLPDVISKSNGIVRQMHTNTNEKLELMMGTLIDETRNNTREIATMKREIYAPVSIKEIKRQEDFYNRAKKASGL